MSAGAKPLVERVLQSIRRHDGKAERAEARRRPRRGSQRQFMPDPDGPFDPLAARTPVTPAILHFIKEREPFEIDGDLYHVETVFRSTKGRQADVLVLRGHEYMRCHERSTRRAIQVRDLETLIDRERVDIPFGGSARQFNIARGWTLGGRTMGSLGISLGGEPTASAGRG